MTAYRLLTVAGLTIPVIGLACFAGCSSSSSNGGGSEDSGTDSPTTDAPSGSSSGGSSSGSSGGSGSSSGGMTGADCGAKIPTLHPNPAGDIYCGYLPGDSGATLDCIAGGDAGGGWCCLGGSLGGGNYAPQICATSSAGCLADGDPDAGKPGIPIQCNQISDCAGNGASGATACCLQGASEETCMGGFTKAFGGSAIVCEGSGGGSATACVAGEIQICSTAADCPSGTTCKPGKWKLYDLGFCQ